MSNHELTNEQSVVQLHQQLSSWKPYAVEEPQHTGAQTKAADCLNDYEQVYREPSQYTPNSVYGHAHQETQPTRLHNVGADVRVMLSELGAYKDLFTTNTGQVDPVQLTRFVKSHPELSAKYCDTINACFRLPWEADAESDSDDDTRVVHFDAMDCLSGNSLSVQVGSMGSDDDESWPA